MTDTTRACAICWADVGDDVGVLIDHLTAEHARATEADVSNTEVAILTAIALQQQIPFASEDAAATLEGLAKIEWRSIVDRSIRN